MYLCIYHPVSLIANQEARRIDRTPRLNPHWVTHQHKCTCTHASVQAWASGERKGADAAPRFNVNLIGAVSCPKSGAPWTGSEMEIGSIYPGKCWFPMPKRRDITEKLRNWNIEYRKMEPRPKPILYSYFYRTYYTNEDLVTRQSSLYSAVFLSSDRFKYFPNRCFYDPLGICRRNTWLTAFLR